MSLEAEFGRLGNAKGRLAEERALAALALPERPPWVLAARRATAAEDARGIDIVVSTDVGPLFLQIKSSGRAARRFAAQRRRSAIAVAVVPPIAVEWDTLRRVVEALESVRASVLAFRSDRANEEEYA